MTGPYDEDDLTMQNDGLNVHVPNDAAQAVAMTILIQSEPHFYDWCRQSIGTGPSSGIFRNAQGELILTRAVNEDGYIEPPTATNPQDQRPSNGPRTVQRLNPASLSAVLRAQYSFWKKDKHGRTIPAAPPLRSLNDCIASPMDMRGVRDYTGFIHAPVVLPDGSLLDQPGWHVGTGLIYLPAPGMERVSVPKAPNREAAERAAGRLMRLLDDFSFATDDHRANYLALLITPAIRRLLGAGTNGSVPIGIINAHDQGSGKTKLCSLIGTVYGGGVVRGPLPADEDEVVKVIATIFNTTTAPVVYFDNCLGVLRSAVMASLATGVAPEIRLLGTNTSVALNNDRLFLLNGNNLSYGGDIERRMLGVLLDPGVPQAWKRPASDFAIPDLDSYVQEHQPELLTAILTMVRAWIIAGQPAAPKVTDRADNFAKWRRVVSGVLAYSGVPGEVMSDASAGDTVDEDRDELLAVLEEAHKRFGAGSFTIAELINPPHAGNFTDDRFEFVPSIIRKGDSDRINARQFSHWLRFRERRFAGNMRFVRFGKDGKTKRDLWQVELRK